MSKPKIAVIGSANVDLIMKMDRLPRVGETVTDAQFYQTYGGKGANQAVSAARAGGNVLFVGCVGDDNYGVQITHNLQDVGINAEYITAIPEVASGTALIMIGELGENYLSVAPGANYYLKPEHVDAAWGKVSEATMVMVQDEISLETLDYTIRRAANAGLPVMFNVAPARNLGNLPLNLVNYLLVNETEASFLTGLPVQNEVQAWNAVDALLAQGSHHVVLTMGAQGCLIAGENIRDKVTSYRVDAVDTTAAGDVFCGALATRMVEEKPILESLQFASAAAAICVTRLGAQPSIPGRDEIVQFMNANTNY